MKILLIHLLLLLAHAFSIFESTEKKEEKQNSPFSTIALTEKTFDSVILSFSKEKAWFVMFYASWCPHCKTLSPIWNQLTNQLKAADIGVGKVDIQENPNLQRRFNVSHLPTLLLFREDGMQYLYEGKRDIDSLVDFALHDYINFSKKKIPPSRTLVDDLPIYWKNIKSDFFLIMKQAKVVGVTLIIFSFFLGFFIRGFCISKKREHSQEGKSVKKNLSGRVKKD